MLCKHKDEFQSPEPVLEAEWITDNPCIPKARREVETGASPEANGLASLRYSSAHNEDSLPQVRCEGRINT